MNISNFSIKRPVATLMIIISMVVVGAVTLTTLPTELFPDFKSPVALITTELDGASPDDMEKLITKKIEDSISTVEGIKKVSSKSSTGVSEITVEFDYNVDIDKKVNDLVTKVSRIRSDLPTDLTQDPAVEKMDSSGTSSITLGLTGDDLIKLKSFAKNIIKPRLERITGVAQVSISGGFEKEILIEINPEKLEGYNLNVSDLYNKISKSSLNFPGGYVREGDKKYVVKIQGEIKTLEDVKKIVVKSKDGQSLRLSQVANVSISTKDLKNYGRTNGQDTVLIKVKKSNSGNAINIANTVKAQLDDLISILPDNSNLSIVEDTSREINNSISSVKQNALIGLLLASAILYIFLKDIRATIIIALSIPVSIVSTFLFFSPMGMSINLISLMGLSLGVGMLVDNSIVVLDNIYRHLTELKKPKMEAARDGASEVIIAIIASTATTVAVFLPVVLREGISKEIFHDMSYAIIFSLLASLLVAITFVPMISSRILSSKKNITSEGPILKRVKSCYIKVLTKALNNRIKVIISTFILFVTVVYLGINNVGGEFFPTIDDGYYSITGELPKGLDIKKANRIAHIYEKELTNNKYTKSYTTDITEDYITITIYTGTPDNRDSSVFQIVDDIRSKISWVPDVKLSVAPGFNEGGGGKDVSLILQSSDDALLKNYSNLIYERLTQIKGLTDFSTTLNGGNPEARIVIDRDKLDYYGIDVADLTYSISYQILGGTPIKIKTNLEELDVTLQLQKKYRESLKLLMDSRIKIPNGKTVKLSQITKLQIAEGNATIEKQDKINKVTLQANNKNGMDLVTSQKNITNLVKEINLPQNIKYSFGGNGEQLADVTGQLVFAFSIAIFLIYCILAAQFESFIIPFIIMGSVPLSITGVYIGLLTTGQKTNIMVFVGIIMLAGIVVNNAIVLIEYILLLMKRGEGIEEALMDAGKARLRPIIMTTMTTVFGMIPLALGLGQGSEMYKGMAIAVVFGLSLSTLLTLIFIPTVFSTYYSLKSKVKSLIIKIINRS